MSVLIESVEKKTKTSTDKETKKRTAVPYRVVHAAGNAMFWCSDAALFEALEASVGKRLEFRAVETPSAVSRATKFWTIVKIEANDTEEPDIDEWFPENEAPDGISERSPEPGAAASFKIASAPKRTVIMGLAASSGYNPEGFVKAMQTVGGVCALEKFPDAKVDALMAYLVKHAPGAAAR